MLRVPEEARQARVLDRDGNAHALSELWCDRTSVLVFLRHFG